MNEPARVIWLSANRLGYELLSAALPLADGRIAAIVTLDPEAPTRMYDGVPLAEWQALGLPVGTVDDINACLPDLARLEPDLIIACGWRQILGPEILALPSGGVVGFHPTLLPIGRGPAPIINSILTGLQDSGLSMFYMDAELDSGDIIAQEAFRIEEHDYAADVYGKTIEAGRLLIADHFEALLEGRAPRRPQDHAAATVFAARSIKDNEINLEQDSPEMIDRKIRAFSAPYLGAFIRLGGQRLIIHQGEIKD